MFGTSAGKEGVVCIIDDRNRRNDRLLLQIQNCTSLTPRSTYAIRICKSNTNIYEGDTNTSPPPTPNPIYSSPARLAMLKHMGSHRSVSSPIHAGPLGGRLQRGGPVQDPFPGL